MNDVMIMIIDAEDAILGRLSSFVAKHLIKGENVDIINAERAIITGNPEATEKKYFDRTQRGSPQHGPFYPSTPNLMVRRSIRGMLPYKKPSGMAAFKKLRVYSGSPKAFEGKEVMRFAEKQKPVECQFMRIEDISRKIR